jgi:diguanylate cyclase (GGDEF)-like protein
VTAQVNARLALESSNASLARESGTDFLTGLANRRVFNEQAEDASAAYLESGESYGLILVDLDDFKLVNDRFGHEIGDQVLRAVGRILRDELRGREDLAARLGGEELAVLCVGNLGEMGLRQLAERIRLQINKETVNSVRGLVRFTASFGVAESQPEDAGWKNIFERADMALYRAKESGKDRVMFGRSAAGSSGRFRKMKLVGGDSPD